MSDVDKIALLTSLLALSAGYVLSLICFICHKLSFRLRTFLFVLITILALVCPLCIPNQFPVFRCLIATTIAIYVFKNWDLYLYPERYRDFTLRQYAPFLMNHCLFFVSSTGGLLNKDTLSVRFRYFLLETIYFSLVFIATYTIFRRDWIAQSFWIEHTFKTTVSGIWLIYAWDWYRSIWRLAGFRTVKFANKPQLAYSPAEFWRRYHREVHRWVYMDVFKPWSVMSPVLALLLAFAVSGLAHEYVVSISLEHFNGYMLLFFLLNGLASAVTWRLKLSGIYKYMGIVFTYIFIIFSAVFFFIPVNEGVSFYSNQVPSWIQLW